MELVIRNQAEIPASCLIFISDPVQTASIPLAGTHSDLNSLVSVSVHKEFLALDLRRIGQRFPFFRIASSIEIPDFVLQYLVIHIRKIISLRSI